MELYRQSHTQVRILLFTIFTVAQERVPECFIRADASEWIEIEAALQKLDCELLAAGEDDGHVVLGARSAVCGPEDDFFQREAFVADGWDRRIEDAAVQSGAVAHSGFAEDCSDFDYGIDVVGAVKEGEALGEDGEEDYARGPDVNFSRLRGAFKEYFWRSEAAGSRAVCAPRWARVVFGVAWGQRCWDRGQTLFPVVGVVGAHTAGRICSLALGKSKVAEYAPTLVVVVQEVCRLDVTVDDLVSVDVREGAEEGAEVGYHVVSGEAAEVFSEIDVLKVGEDGYDLVLVPEGGDEWNNGSAA